MKIINRMHEKNIDTKKGCQNQNEMRALVDAVISGEKSRAEIKEICEALIAEQDHDMLEGFWPIIACKKMPFDAEVDFIHIPTHYANIIMLRAYLMNLNDELAGFDECFKLGLLASIKSDLRGHGYEASRNQLEFVKLFLDAGLLDFLYLYEDFCPEFSEGMSLILSKIKQDYQEGKTKDDWGVDYTKLYELIVNQNYSLKAFVYGTLMKGESNHHFIDSCTMIGDAEIKGYDIFDTGYSYPAIIYSENNDSVVDGEIYLIDKKVLERLDYLEDNGEMYTREFTVAIDENGDKHLALVYKYNYEVYEDKKIVSWKGYSCK